MSRSPAIAVVDGAGATIEAGDPRPVAWWSLTKTAIAALALRLSDAGRLDLDAPEPGAAYCLRQLLRHTAGLPDYGALPDYRAAVAAGGDPWSDAELLDRTRADRLLFAPGAGWRYSNVGYLLARRRLETRLGQPLADALARHVLLPLGLGGTKLAATAGEMAGLLLPPPHPYHPGWVFHGTLIGPVCEAALFVDRLMRPGFLSQRSRRLLLASQRIADAGVGRPWRETGYATGTMTGEWEMAPGRRAGVIGHGAGGPGSQGATFRIAAGMRSVTVSAYGHDLDASVEHLALEAARPHL